MGRTVPSFRMLLEEIIVELSVFRRALRGEDKAAFDSLMKGEEVYLNDVGGRVWSGIAPHVPVNWPPTDQPHFVRVFDPHLVLTPNGGVTAARLLVGGQTIYFFDSPGTPQESGLIYVDDNGVGHNPS